MPVSFGTSALATFRPPRTTHGTSGEPAAGPDPPDDRGGPDGPFSLALILLLAAVSLTLAAWIAYERARGVWL